MKVVITEKYNQGEVVADTILDSGGQQKIQGEPVWMGKIEGEQTVIVPLAGQIFEIDNTEGRRGYPDFPEIEWKVKGHHRSKHDVLSDLLPKADEVIIGSDYDREGELIGTLAVLIPVWDDTNYNLLKDWDTEVSRMEYSAMTESEVKDAWEDRGEPDEGLFMMGMARAEIDYRVGINLSKALAECLMSHRGKYRTMSAGRVQSPTLSIVKERSDEHRNHDPETYWVPQIEI